MPEKRPCWAVAKALPLLPHRSARDCICSNGFMSHHHDLADGFAVVQQIESYVDVVELEVRAHQAVYRQPAAPIQFDVARDVPRRYARADIAALHGPRVAIARHSFSRAQSRSTWLRLL